MTSWVEATYSCAGEPPAFIEQELERLYGTRFSCLPRFKLHGRWDRVRAYVARRDGAIVAVFLFHCEGSRAVVLNEGMSVAAEVVNRFASYLFRNHDALSVVTFHYVETGAGALLFPHQGAACGRDTVLALPDSAAAYTARLSASTRSSLDHRIRRIRRLLPDFSFAVYEKEDVPLRQLRAIIRLHRLNQAGVRHGAPIDAAEEERIIAYVALCGFVSVASAGGKLLAGVITYRLGANFTARILAHDPAWAGYRLSFVCAYLTICQCIEAGNSRYFHFGWGQRDYKRQLGGRVRRLVHLSLFRSRLHALRHLGASLAALAGAAAFHLREAVLHSARHQRRLPARLAGLVVLAGRRLRALRLLRARRPRRP